MAEIFFLEHRNIEVRVDALNSEQIALELGTTRYILNPSEAIQVAEMLSLRFHLKFWALISGVWVPGLGCWVLGAGRWVLGSWL